MYKDIINTLNKNPIIVDWKTCISCDILCKRSMEWHWLLKNEVTILKNYIEIIEIGDAHFFAGGLCSCLNNNKCSIYNIRPLECKMSPVSITRIDNELWWILDRSCLVVRDPHKYSSFSSKLLDILVKLDTFMDAKLIDEFNSIADALKSIGKSLRENIDYIRLKPVID